MSLLIEDQQDKLTLHQKFSNHPMLVGEIPINTQTNKNSQANKTKNQSTEQLNSEQFLMFNNNQDINLSQADLKQQQQQHQPHQHHHLHDMGAYKKNSQQQSEPPNSPYRSPHIIQEDHLLFSPNEQLNTQTSQYNKYGNGHGIPDISLHQNASSHRIVGTGVMGNSNIVEHSISIKYLQQLYRFDGERGLTNHQVVENRTISRKNNQNVQSSINIQKAIDQQWDVVKKFLLEYKLAILLASIIFFFYFAYYQDDPSQILLALFLVWIIVVNKRKSFDQLQSEKLARTLKEFIPSTCTVIREGKEITVLTSSVVAGDIIILKKDSLCPADSRVYSIDKIDNTQVMKADISMLFQEKIPRVLSKVCNYPTNYLKSQNVVPQGAKIIQGSGKVIALMSANDSFCQQKINQLADLSLKTIKTKNPIKSELNQFATYLSYIAIIIAIVFLLVTKLEYDSSVMTAFIFAGCVLIAFVPEGLLTQVYLAKFVSKFTVCKHADQNQSQKSFKINKYDQVIENLSQINCICTNFNSLIEQSQAQVSGIWVNNTALNSVREIYLQQEKNNDNKTYQSLLVGSLLANESYFSTPSQSTTTKEASELQGVPEYLPYEAEGRSIDTALLRFCQPICDVELARRQYPIAVNENGNHVMVPFDDELKFCASVVHEKTQQGDYVLYIKGDPKTILKQCSSIEIDGKVYDIKQEIQDSFKSTLSNFQKIGDDVVAVAKLIINRNEYPAGKVTNFFDFSNKLKIKLSNLTLLGLFSFSCPISYELDKSLRLAKLSGTRLLVVTEKDPLTAFGIAQNCGLFSEIDQEMNKIVVDEVSEQNEYQIELASQLKKALAVVVNGDRLKKVGDAKGSLDSQILECLNKQICIFANTNFEQKNKLMPYLRNLGYKVGVTSNQIEDLTFMSTADICFSGTDATPLQQQLSDVALIRNKYQSDIQAILEAIEEGRSYQENVKKIFAFSGSTKMAQIIPLMAYIILRLPLPLSAMFMILLSCVTNFIPALSLSREEPDIDTLFIKLEYQQPKNNIQPQNKSRSSSNKVATFKLFFYSYFFLGMIATGAGFCAYFTTMNHFGFPIESTYKMFNRKGYLPNTHIAEEMGYDIDVVHNYIQTIEQHVDIPADTPLDSSKPHWNSLFMSPYNDCEYDLKHHKPTHDFIDWGSHDQSKFDLRKFYVYCDLVDKKWKNSISWSECNPKFFINYSTLTDNSACYTSEALNYAQTAYFLAVVFFQFSNLLALKSLRWSFIHTPFNGMLAFSIIFQLILCVIIVEIPGIQLIFRSRPLHFWQWGIPAIPFSIFVLLHEEIRKYLARSTKWFRKIATF